MVLKIFLWFYLIYTNYMNKEDSINDCLNDLIFLGETTKELIVNCLQYVYVSVYANIYEFQKEFQNIFTNGNKNKNPNFMYKKYEENPTKVKRSFSDSKIEYSTLDENNNDSWVLLQIRNE